MMKMLPSVVMVVMGVVLTLLLSQEAAAGRCKPYRGDIGFNIENAEPCQAEKLRENVYLFKSPGYPNNYPDHTYCEAKISTNGPRYLVFRPRQFDVLEKDHVTIRFPFGGRHRFTVADKRKNIYIPSSRAVIKFRTSARNNDKGFNIKIKAKTLRCHQVCDLSSGDSGTLEMQSYAAHTFCEWWMEAPEGCTIQLQFLNFNVGQSASPGSNDCPGDYLAVSRRGDKDYDKPKSKSFCGTSVPSDTSSVENKINVLFNGDDGGEGFKIDYKVQCEVSATTTPSTILTTTAPTATPNSATSTAAPNSATSTAAPNSATSTAAPNSATSTAAPNSATSTAAPNSATSTAASNSATSTATPNSATSTAASNSATSTAAPNSATSTAAPNSATSTAAPNSATSTAASNSATSTATPNSTTSTAPSTSTTAATP
ncbi:CUB domain [Trinorchestia longiramus]|nr:CUB domain [Trinorchestia longiramus]